MLDSKSRRRSPISTPRKRRSSEGSMRTRSSMRGPPRRRSRRGSGSSRVERRRPAGEPKKVIEDILDEARRDRETRVARDSLSELRAKVEAHAKFGADVRTAAEILARAEAMIDAGELHEVGGYAKRISEEVDLARKAHLGSVVGSFLPMIEEGVSLGLDEEELEEYRA